jgi:hypothetical protein
MALSYALTITPDKGASEVKFHGASGVIRGQSYVGERFRRPGSYLAGYQRLGKDVPACELTWWYAAATPAAVEAFRLALEALPFQRCKVTYGQHTKLPAVVLAVEMTATVATKGPIITGTTRATRRCEGRLTLEVLP